jgi:hypothetical protein
VPVIRFFLAALLLVLVGAPVLAEDLPLASDPALVQKIEPPPAAEPAPDVVPPPKPAVAVPPSPIPAAAPAPVTQSPLPVVVPPVVVPSETGVPGWAVGLLVLAGSVIAAGIGQISVTLLRRRELAERRGSVAATLALELSTRLQAFDTVPVPPNAEAGVSFVSDVLALSSFDCGFRSAQGALHLLPGKLPAHIALHYAAVQRVAVFVRGQSVAAGIRMLQANRIGGHPCPDAGTMRQAHVELAAAFNGVDKLVEGLNRLG